MGKSFLLFLIVPLTVISGLAQNGVAINSLGNAPHSSAILDISSNNKGFLIPRMSTAERDLIINPAEGLQIYNTDTKCFEFFAYGVWQIMSCASPSSSWVCGDQIVDVRDGQTYNTVPIGSQCWIKENLNYDQTLFGNDWCYDNDQANCFIYGRLYDWAAALQGATGNNFSPSGIQGVCPVGWHMPSHNEWTTLERAVCNTATCLTDFPYDESTAGSFRGTDEADKLKSTTFWATPSGTNSSGFTALPNGSYDGFFDFSAMQYVGYWWTATEYGVGGWNAWAREIDHGGGGILRNVYGTSSGFAVRCVKD